MNAWVEDKRTGFLDLRDFDASKKRLREEGSELDKILSCKTVLLSYIL
jgi:hypothetical protein